MEKYKYDCWDGGPFIVLPESAIGSWHGVVGDRDPLDPQTDYGRACAIKGKFELIPVGNEQALVLGPDPPMVAYSPRSTANEIDLFILEAWNKVDLDTLIDKRWKARNSSPAA